MNDYDYSDVRLTKAQLNYLVKIVANTVLITSKRCNTMDYLEDIGLVNVHCHDFGYYKEYTTMAYITTEDWLEKQGYLD